MSGVFFGLVIGTIFHLRDLIKFDEWRNIIMIFLGISFGLILSFLDPAKENDNLLFCFCMWNDKCNWNDNSWFIRIFPVDVNG